MVLLKMFSWHLSWYATYFMPNIFNLDVHSPIYLECCLSWSFIFNVFFDCYINFFYLTSMPEILSSIICILLGKGVLLAFLSFFYSRYFLRLCFLYCFSFLFQVWKTFICFLQQQSNRLFYCLVSEF